MSRLFEGWHLVILLVVVLLLFGGKRLPDAARGLGRSLRIFKSEVKEMQEENKPKTPPSAAVPPEPLEGRIIADDSGRAPTPSEQRREV